MKPELAVALAQARGLMGDFIAAGRWIAVYICPRGAVDWHVSVQVQTDAADPHVQGLEASHLLPLQHGESLPSQMLFCFFLAVRALSPDLLGENLLTMSL